MSVCAPPSARHARPWLLACTTLLSPVALAQVQQLESIVISGKGEETAYYQRHSEVGRTDTPIREVPQAIQVVSSQTLQDTGATRLADAYRMASGISQQNNFGGLWDNFSVRGFSGHTNTGPNLLQNGFAGNRGYNAPRDTANVERIEVLKGPASALYGSAEPGGIINVVNKRPQFTPAHSVELGAGSHDFVRAAIDSTGPVSDVFAYRINAAVERSNSFRDYVRTRRTLVAPSFSWQLARGTLLDYSLEYLQHRAPMDRGVLARDGELGTVPRSRFLGEPGDGDTVIDNLSHQLTLHHDLAGDWRAKLGLSYRTTHLEGDSTQVWPANPMVFVPGDSNDVRRERRYRDYHSHDLAFQGEVQGSVQALGLHHELLLGLDSYRYTLDEFVTTSQRSDNDLLNIHDPVYGQLPPTSNPHTNTRERQRSLGVFVQNQIHVADDWRLLLGLRHERFRRTFTNHRTGQQTDQADNITTPRLGLTWLMTPTWSAYALTSRSFRPNLGSDAAGNAFAPERGKAQEVGLKYESDDARLGATLALFHIEKTNVVTNDPSNPGYSVAAGKARSRGVELDLTGQITDALRLTANYAYTDARITQDNNATLEGARLVNAPRHSANLLLMYEAAAARGRYGVGGGLSYVGERGGNAADTFSLPGYTTARLMAYWQASPALRLSVDVDNVFDRTYYASSYDVYWVMPGTPRTVRVGMQYRF